MVDNNIIFERSKVKHKKYVAILPDGKRVNFGDTRYQQFEDRTNLKLYSSLDHHDENRRRLYFARHNKTPDKYSPGWFSSIYLWAGPSKQIS